MTRLALWRLGFTFESPFFLLSREELFQEEQEEKLKVKQKQPKRGVKACCICCSFCSFFHHIFSISCWAMFQRLRMFWRRSMVLTDLKISFIPSFPRPILTGVSQVSQVSLEISPLFVGFHFFFQVWFPHQTRLRIPERWDWELSRWLLMPEANSVNSQEMGRTDSISQKVLCCNNLQFCSSSTSHPKLFVFAIRICYSLPCGSESTLTIHGWSKVFRIPCDEISIPQTYPLVDLLLFSICFPHSTCSTHPCGCGHTWYFSPWAVQVADPPQRRQVRNWKWMLLQMQALLQWMLRSRYFMSICIYSIHYTVLYKIILYQCHIWMIWLHHVRTLSVYLTWSLARRVKKLEELRCFARLRGQFFFQWAFSVQSIATN